MPTFTGSDHTQLFYDDWGGGAPVVFSHGWMLGAAIWEYQMTAMAEAGCRGIAFDRRGCGRSDHPGTGYDFDTLADDLGALLEQLDLRDVTLVGHSMGCGEIVRYLARHGDERVARVVLISTVTPFLLKTDDNPNGADAVFRDVTIQGLQQDRPQFLRQGAPVFFGAGLPGVEFSDEMLEWGLSLALQASPLATMELIRSMWDTDFRLDLGKVNVPALVIHGRLDQGSPIESTGRPTAAAIAGSRLEEYDTAHGLFLTEKDRLNTDLIAFVR